MENNLENKAKFFAQYWGQMVLADVTNGGKKNIYPVETSNMFRIEESHLELKPLLSISDEDAQSIAKIENDYVDPVVRGKNLANWIFRDISSDFHCVNMRFKILLQIIDFLRSKGYVLPWMGLSVEKQLEYGWIKLKND